jgi:predicted O-methyltransferase YrrM
MAPDGGRTEPLRQLIARYYGEQCRIVAVRRSGGAYLFVVEATLRGRHLRLLGTVGRTREVMEHSAMDLGAPQRLVFPYERLMLASLALVAAPRAVLLLGLGGGAMCRHLAAHLPGLAVTVVERDAAVIALAREHFYFDGGVVRADAADVVADAREAFDAILVDLYDAGGAAPLEDRFWEDCIAALKPGGCIAINWAGGWTGAGLEGTPRQRIARVMPKLKGSFLAYERGPRGNIVQFAPTDPAFRLAALEARLGAFAQRYRLPREDRDVLKRCDLGARYPTRGQGGKLGRKAGAGGKRGR